MGCDLYIDRRVMPRHRRHRGSSLEQRLSKRASVPGPKNGPCFRRIVRFPRPMKEITTSRPFARLSILRCFPLQTRILVGVSISGSCAFLPAVRSVSSFFLPSSSRYYSPLLSAARTLCYRSRRRAPTVAIPGESWRNVDRDNLYRRTRPSSEMEIF